MNKDQETRESKYDRPQLSELFERNSDWFTSLDVACVDLTHLKEFKFNFKNLSTLSFGRHTKGWRRFASSMIGQSANTLTSLRLSGFSFLAPKDEEDTVLSLENKLPNLTHLTLKEFKKNTQINTHILPELVNKCCSNLKYLSLEDVAFFVDEIALMPKLEKCYVKGIPYPQFQALCHKMPNLRELEIGELKRVDEYDEGLDKSLRMPRLESLKIFDDNVAMSNKLIIFGLRIAEASLKDVYVYSGECAMYCRNFMQFRPNIKMHEIELPNQLED